MTKDSFERKILRLKLERGQRRSLPFASFALSLLALPLGIQPPRAQRNWGAGISATLGMLVFVFYYGLLSIGIVLAQNQTISPVAALWIPNVSILAVALYAIYKTGTEQWQSIAHGFENLLSLIMRLKKKVTAA